MKKAKLAIVEGPLKLDLGCGKNTREGFEGVDVRDFGQKWHCDFRKIPWCLTYFAIKQGQNISYPVAGADPIPDDSVEEVHCSHFVEHLTAMERVHFCNELYRILRKDGKATIITPHWASCRAYGDLTHQWPPVSEFWWYYLDKGWREQNAPHNDFYKCDFLATWGYNMHPAIVPRNSEYQQHAMQFWKEAVQDMICTLVKK